MDAAAESIAKIITQRPFLAPAQLWIGDADTLIEKAKKFLQQRWCTANGCGKCSLCNSIESEQHYSIRWFAPDGWYKREDIADLFSTIALGLEQGQEYFFIIQKADCLPAACFNSLLKSIEEPPEGYHFIFFAQRANDVAATIRSRCIIRQFVESIPTLLTHPLASLFVGMRHITPYEFMQVLDAADLDEQITIELLDALLGHWLSQSKKAIGEKNNTLSKQAELMIALIKAALEEPPMSGSSSLFWKQFFMTIYG